MKKVMFIPTHAPQSEMFRSVVDVLLRANRDILIQVVDLHPQHQGIIAFRKESNHFQIIEMKHNLGYVLPMEKIGVVSRLLYYFTLESKRSEFRAEVAQMLERSKPDLLVLAHDTMISHRIFIEEANRRHIPSLLIQEGTIARSYNLNLSWTLSGRLRTSLKQIGRDIRNTVFPATKQEKYGHGDTTKIAVWGDYTRQLLIDENVDASRIVITGSPRYDTLHTFKVDREEIMEELGLLPTTKLILYIDQRLIQNRIFSKSEAYQYTRSIFSSILEIPDTQLVVKLRVGPGKYVSLDLTNKVIDDIRGTERTVVTEKYLYELLAMADVVVIFSSTVGMEAILMDKPLVSVNFTDNEQYPYIESGAALGCRTPQDIFPAIRRALFDTSTMNSLARNRKEFIAEHLCRHDGKASARTAGFILQLIKLNA